MQVFDRFVFHIEGKGEYENFLDENGQECEYLNGVALTDGYYCKHYRRARDWGDKKNVDDNGLPLRQHYCEKYNSFAGWSCCCWPNGKCFEKGKSAGVQRIRNKIRKHRIKEGLIIERCSPAGDNEDTKG